MQYNTWHKLDSSYIYQILIGQAEYGSLSTDAYVCLDDGMDGIQERKMLSNRPVGGRDSTALFTNSSLHLSLTTFTSQEMSSLEKNLVLSFFPFFFRLFDHLPTDMNEWYVIYYVLTYIYILCMYFVYLLQLSTLHPNTSLLHYVHTYIGRE